MITVLEEPVAAFITLCGHHKPLQDAKLLQAFASYCGMLATLADPLPDITSPLLDAKSTCKPLTAITSPCRMLTSLAEPYQPSRACTRHYNCASRTSTSVLELLQDTVLTWPLPALTSICGTLTGLVRSLSAFTSYCGTLTPLAGPLPGFTRLCRALTAFVARTSCLSKLLLPSRTIAGRKLHLPKPLPALMTHYGVITAAVEPLPEFTSKRGTQTVLPKNYQPSLYKEKLFQACR